MANCEQIARNVLWNSGCCPPVHSRRIELPRPLLLTAFVTFRPSISRGGHGCFSIGDDPCRSFPLLPCGALRAAGYHRDKAGVIRRAGREQLSADASSDDALTFWTHNRGNC